MSTLKVSTISPLGTDATKTITLGESGGTLGIASGAKTSGFGKVGQIVTATTTSNTITSSTSFVITNLSASITPTSTTSKILIIVSGNTFVSSGEECVSTLYRDSSNLSDTKGFNSISNSAGTLTGVNNITFLDSPSTTSSTTFTLYIRSVGGGSVNHIGNAAKATITLMEILD